VEGHTSNVSTEQTGLDIVGEKILNGMGTEGDCIWGKLGGARMNITNT